MLQNLSVRSRMLLFAGISVLFTASVGIMGLASLRFSVAHEKELCQNGSSRKYVGGLKGSVSLQA